MKIRLIGVDAPESKNSRTKEMAYFGREASDYLTSLIAGRKVRLEYDVGQFDKYGRTLAYVYLEDGTFVNATLVKNGYATVMTVPPNVKYADTFLKLERKARNQKRGLWRDIWLFPSYPVKEVLGPQYHRIPQNSRCCKDP